jgi:hypothetical protein
MCLVKAVRSDVGARPSEQLPATGVVDKQESERLFRRGFRIIRQIQHRNLLGAIPRGKLDLPTAHGKEEDSKTCRHQDCNYDQ